MTDKENIWYLTWLDRWSEFTEMQQNEEEEVFKKKH
jgi:hypothetical protein